MYMAMLMSSVLILSRMCVCVCVCVFVILIYVFGHAYVFVLILSRMYDNGCVSSHSALSHNPHLPNPSFFFFLFIYLHASLSWTKRGEQGPHFQKEKCLFDFFIFFSYGQHDAR